MRIILLILLMGDVWTIALRAEVVMCGRPWEDWAFPPIGLLWG